MQEIIIKRILAIFLFFVVMFMYFLYLAFTEASSIATMLSALSFFGVIIFGRKYFLLRKNK